MSVPSFNPLLKQPAPPWRRPLRQALLAACVALVLATAALGWNIANAAALTVGG